VVPPTACCCHLLSGAISSRLSLIKGCKTVVVVRYCIVHVHIHTHAHMHVHPHEHTHEQFSQLTVVDLDLAFVYLCCFNRGHSACVGVRFCVCHVLSPSCCEFGST